MPSRHYRRVCSPAFPTAHPSCMSRSNQFSPPTASQLTASQLVYHGSFVSQRSHPCKCQPLPKRVCAHAENTPVYFQWRLGRSTTWRRADWRSTLSAWPCLSSLKVKAPTSTQNESRPRSGSSKFYSCGVRLCSTVDLFLDSNSNQPEYRRHKVPVDRLLLVPSVELVFQNIWSGNSIERRVTASDGAYVAC